MKNILMDPKHQPANLFRDNLNLSINKVAFRSSKTFLYRVHHKSLIIGGQLCGAFFIPLFKPIMQNPTMKVCIIGGGLAGLCAALQLKGRHEVVIYEKKGQLGGCLASHRIEDYWIEQFYHHCFSGDRHLLALFSQLHISDRVEWRKGTSGYFAEDTIYPLNTPFEILKYPLLSATDKLRLALLTMRSRWTDPAGLDEITARDYILSEVGQRTYESFFEPLLKSKFGAMSGNVSAAWLIGRIAIRSDRGWPESASGTLRAGSRSSWTLSAISSDVTARSVSMIRSPLLHGILMDGG
jgi:protoporphyrinogen oxidase